MYGDPNIHFNTDDVNQDRHLVFGDGTKLPENGMVVYHDAGTKQNWAQNDDGTVSPVGPDGNLGAPIAPTGYRKIGDRYAPVDARGQQIGPQLGGVPSSDNGFYTDPKTGILTPKNANGDYFTVGPDGKKSFFDKNGAPISEAQFNNANRPRDPAQPQPGPGLPTDEQQSGKAADAVKKLQGELKNHYSTLSDAEEKLSEVLLNAHATTSAGRDKLNDIQQKLVNAVNNPTMDMTSPAGERSFLTFLRSQVSEINDVLSSGALSAEDQAKFAQALAALYAAGDAAGQGGDPSTQQQQPSGPSSPAPASPAPDPAPAGPRRMRASAIPAWDRHRECPTRLCRTCWAGARWGPIRCRRWRRCCLAHWAGWAGWAALEPARWTAWAGWPGPRRRWRAWPRSWAIRATTGMPPTRRKSPPMTPPGTARTTRATRPTRPRPTPPRHRPATSSPPGSRTSRTPAPHPGLGDRPRRWPLPARRRPRSSCRMGPRPLRALRRRRRPSATTWPALPIDSAYRQNGIQLPPPGTPVTSPVDPTRVTCGDVAMFKDHYVPVLSSVKAFLNGQVVPLGSVSSSPDFLGFIDPTAAAAAAGSPPPPPAPAATPAPAPPPAASPAGVAAPVPAG